MRLRRRLLLAAVIAGAALAFPHAPGRADGPARPAGLEAGASLDPLDLFRAARSAGDAELQRLLEADDADPRQRRLAVEAAPYAVAPIELLAPLSRLAAGRDPELAPAAARVSIVLAEQLGPSELARHEVLPAELAPVRATFRRLSRDRDAREDLRSAGARLDGMLRSLLE